jgi:DNA gyrase subunit A
MILRMKAGDVRVIGRATQGVRLLGMEEGDRVVAIAKLLERDDDAANGSSTPSGDSGTAVAPVESTLEIPQTPPDEGENTGQ